MQTDITSSTRNLPTIDHPDGLRSPVGSRDKIIPISPVLRAVQTIANEVTDQVDLLRLTDGTSTQASEPFSVNSNANTNKMILQQIYSETAVPKFKDQPRWQINSSVGKRLQQVSKQIKPFITEQERHLITVKSTLSENEQEKIGLFRAPNLNEERVLLKEYNLSMSEEALVLGSHHQNLVLADNTPTFASMWAACRAWRVGHLNADVTEIRLERFTSPRLNKPNNPQVFGTPFSPEDIMYGHLFDLLDEHEFIDGANDQQLNECILQKHTFARSFDRALINRVSVQFTTTIDQQQIPLTEIRLSLNNKGQTTPDEWTHTQLSRYPIEYDITVDKPHNKNAFCAVMHHTHSPYLGLLEKEVERKIQAHGNWIKKNQVELLKDKNLSELDDKNPLHQHLLKELGDLHYLLSHAMFDQRGSASKSELLIRILAVSAHIELPPFEQGCTPDLEAFVTSRHDFSEKYIGFFEAK